MDKYNRYYEKYLNPCPICGGSIIDKSYDRRIVFRCSVCNYDKCYPGVVQTKVSPVPIPYKGGNFDDRYQEYYHQNAYLFAIEEFNKWVSSEIRNKKIKSILNENLG